MEITEALEVSRQACQQLLLDNIVPFWYPQVIDYEQGGYRLNHDTKGRWHGPANKRLVTQARTTWFFSCLAKSPYGNDAHLRAAEHGFNFLHNRMWDAHWGGFYWEVDADGTNPTMPCKHLYGQAAALYALSEFASASAERAPREMARELCGLLQRHARDKKFGGYREFFNRDWTRTAQDARGYLGEPAGAKLTNTHLHLLEAFTRYHKLEPSREVRDRLLELIFIQSNAVVGDLAGICRAVHAADWTPFYQGCAERVSYGHNLENIWLLVDACEAARICNGPLHGFYRSAFAYALRYGFDRKAGGFYDAGFWNKPADECTKIWWVQAESIVSALYMYRLTRQQIYLECFLLTLSWILRYQADWKHGEWHAAVRGRKPNLQEKAGQWKGPYHTGRAVLRCLELLEELAISHDAALRSFPSAASSMPTPG